MLFPFSTASLTKTLTSWLACANCTFLAKSSRTTRWPGVPISLMIGQSQIYNIFFATMISDSESSQSYSSEEVLWAKIQGHPWWPAFVDQVHREGGGRVEYTVNFFGDCTQLGASKLNKFQKHYAEHYRVARTHRKLMASLQMAERTLKENSQNVQVYQEIRDQLKQKRFEGTTVRGKQKHKSSVEGQQESDELPPLKHARTSTGSRASRSQARVERAHDGSKEEDKRKERNQRNLSVSGKQKRLRWKSEDSKQFAEGGLLQSRPKDKTHAIGQKQISEQESVGAASIDQKSAEDLFYERKIKASILKNPAPAQRVPRKRGRPKMAVSQQNNQPACPDHKRKIIQKVSSKKVSSLVAQASLSKEDSLIIEQTRLLLRNREELVDYLTSTAITIHNVQEVLELGVVQVLREGDSCRQAEEVIAMLMKVLMLKHFPHDTKEKPTRRGRKHIVFVEDHSGEQDMQQAGLSGEVCRKKTIAKLQKFLSRQPELPNGFTSTELSVRFEAAFFRLDSSIGHSYKGLALKVLNALKKGSETAGEVMKKLKVEGSKYE